MKNIIIISSLLLSSVAHSQNVTTPTPIQSNVEKKPEIDYFKMEVIKTTADLNKQRMYLHYIIGELKSLSPNVDISELEKKALTKEDIQRQKDIETLQTEIEKTKIDLANNQEKLNQQIAEYHKKYEQLQDWENKLQVKETQLVNLENQLANQDVELLSQSANLEKIGKKLAEKEFELEFKTSIIFQQKEEIDRLQTMTRNISDNNKIAVVTKPYTTPKNVESKAKKVEKHTEKTNFTEKSTIKVEDKVKINEAKSFVIEKPLKNNSTLKEKKVDDSALSFLTK